MRRIISISMELLVFIFILIMSAVKSNGRVAEKTSFVAGLFIGVGIIINQFIDEIFSYYLHKKELSKLSLLSIFLVRACVNVCIFFLTYLGLEHFANLPASTFILIIISVLTTLIHHIFSHITDGPITVCKIPLFSYFRLENDDDGESDEYEE